MSSSSYEKVQHPDAPSDSDDYDDTLAANRKSEDVRKHDYETISAEEEAERLLGGEKASRIGKSGSEGHGRSGRRRSNRNSRNEKRGGAEGKLMYEMEEGGPRSSSAESSSAGSSESDLQRLGETQTRRKTSKLGQVGKFAGIHIVIVAAFLALLYGAYNASARMEKKSPVAQTLSNGTHAFAPTTLLMSLDGFRADFLARNLTPALNSFVREGVSPEYMTPSFPSLTFPNHFTLVTGLHPESHGIVGNTFYDPLQEKQFDYGDPSRSMQPEWWQAEPLWLTAELAGVRSAIHMWPGSEAHIGSMEPAYVDEFNQDEKLDKKAKRILGWLDLPDEQDQPRPQFIAAYVPDVDADGHKYGPNSTHVRSTIQKVDDMLASIFQGIGERNLTDIVNIIIVSDHGMATTSNQRLIQLEDLVDPTEIAHTDGWPLYGLRPHDDSEDNLTRLYNDLKAKSKQQNSFDVYLRDKDMPARYHFTQNPRIAPLWLIPHVGWAIVTKDEFDVSRGQALYEMYSPRGLHGYDHQHPLMRAIFFARGPAFPHPGGSRVEPFQNLEVYNLVCDSLGLEPGPNNGTLRLPLETKGKHDFDRMGEMLDDVEEDTNGMKTATTAANATATQAKPTRPVVHDEEGKESDGANQWMDWVKGKFDGIKGWAKEQIEQLKGKMGGMEEKGDGG